ncbi:hypothetical protein [Nocardia salmonicida]|uniref:hypothetical protein n=1 Tax=Nocardia salmonicida TaxID=53431 RepID=UPI003791094C
MRGIDTVGETALQHSVTVADDMGHGGNCCRGVAGVVFEIDCADEQPRQVDTDLFQCCPLGGRTGFTESDPVLVA